MLKVLLLTLATNWPSMPSDADHYPTNREDWLVRVVESVDVATQAVMCEGGFANETCVKLWSGTRKELAVLLLVESFWESRISARIQAGACRSDECDSYKNHRTGKVQHAAVSMWQLHQSGLTTPDLWMASVGTDPENIQIAAFNAARILGKSRSHCSRRSSSWVHGAISAYATGASCDWPGAKVRVQSFYRSLSVTPNPDLAPAHWRTLEPTSDPGTPTPNLPVAELLSVGRPIYGARFVSDRIRFDEPI